MVAMRMISLLAAMLLLGSCTGTEFESTMADHRATWVEAGLRAWQYELILDDELSITVHRFQRTGS